MPRIHSIEQANQLLQPYVPLAAKLTGEDSTLDRTRPLLAALGNPQKKLRAVHIAGTSGKTSTAYFMAALLQGAGKHVGLTISPHIDSITERVQLDGRPLSDDAFCAYLGEFLDIVEEGGFQPSYFELLTAFSFWVFEREGVDYAVLETGLGGRYDTTNLADRHDKLCIITDIGFDHMNILGNTLEEIAGQKAGIIHAGNNVIMYPQSAEVDGVIRERVEKVQATLHEATGTTEVNFAADLPEFQKRNWQLAYAAYQLLQQRDGLPDLSSAQLRTTQDVQVPARMDVFQIAGKRIIMDGAHNGQKMHTFLASFVHQYPGVKPAVMIALKRGKEPADVVPLLAPFAARIIVTEFNTAQDLPAVSFAAQELADIFKAHNVPNVVVEPDNHQAFQQLLNTDEDICIVTGSFYLLSQLRTNEGLTHSL
ncbi:MAG TPA: Mur ligase family protein [Candidatus Microsaccharimonas sp.]|nr:Mur ligase family protein [Candidatus Microsaccharimonas sp.]